MGIAFAIALSFAISMQSIWPLAPLALPSAMFITSDDASPSRATLVFISPLEFLPESTTFSFITFTISHVFLLHTSFVEEKKHQDSDVVRSSADQEFLFMGESLTL
jgi:hypothetical protein